MSLRSTAIDSIGELDGASASTFLLDAAVGGGESPGPATAASDAPEERTAPVVPGVDLVMHAAPGPTVPKVPEPTGEVVITSPVLSYRTVDSVGEPGGDGGSTFLLDAAVDGWESPGLAAAAPAAPVIRAGRLDVHAVPGTTVSKFPEPTDEAVTRTLTSTVLRSSMVDFLGATDISWRASNDDKAPPLLDCSNELAHYLTFRSDMVKSAITVQLEPVASYMKLPVDSSNPPHLLVLRNYAGFNLGTSPKALRDPEEPGHFAVRTALRLQVGFDSFSCLLREMANELGACSDGQIHQAAESLVEALRKEKEQQQKASDRSPLDALVSGTGYLAREISDEDLDKIYSDQCFERFFIENNNELRDSVDEAGNVVYQSTANSFPNQMQRKHRLAIHLVVHARAYDASVVFESGAEGEHGTVAKEAPKDPDSDGTKSQTPLTQLFLEVSSLEIGGKEGNLKITMADSWWFEALWEKFLHPKLTDAVSNAIGGAVRKREDSHRSFSASMLENALACCTWTGRSC
jgi:hypothetical protein